MLKIFYTASFLGKQKYQKYFNAVREAIEACGVELVSPEKGNYKDVMTEKEIDALRDPKLVHYEAIRRGISWADAVIIEISNEDFQLGHEATLAINSHKHVLCLSLFEDFSEKIENRYFHGAKYSELNVDLIVADFLKMVEGERLDERFNLFLSTAQTEYLEKSAETLGINKSEYVRRLIEKDRRLKL